MKPIARPEGHILLAASPDTRPPPAEFAEFFDTMATVARHVAGEGSERYAAFRALADAARGAQVFDFGAVAEPFLMEEAKLGGAMLCERFVKLPYAGVLYWYTLTELQHPGTVAKVDIPSWDVDRVRYATLVAEAAGGGWLIADFMVLDPATAAQIGRDIVRGSGGKLAAEVGAAKALLLCTGIARVESVPEGRWRGRLFDRAGEDDNERRDSAALGALADGAAAMTMILATKGVGLRRDPAPAKLNAKREKQGRPAYPAITYVNTREYVEAAERTARGGTHASPVPHLRRGHPRVYADGRRTWVRAALVNCRSVTDAQSREHYVVRT